MYVPRGIRHEAAKSGTRSSLHASFTLGRRSVRELVVAVFGALCGQLENESVDWRSEACPTVLSVAVKQVSGLAMELRDDDPEAIFATGRAASVVTGNSS